MCFRDYVNPCYDGLLTDYGLNYEGIDDALFWNGQSLPPELARRGYDARGTWKRREMADLIDSIMPDTEISLAGFHRKLKEAAEFASVFGDEHPSDFKKNLKEYLKETTTP